MGGLTCSACQQGSAQLFQLTHDRHDSKKFLLLLVMRYRYRCKSSNKSGQDGGLQSVRGCVPRCQPSLAYPLHRQFRQENARKEFGTSSADWQLVCQRSRSLPAVQQTYPRPNVPRTGGVGSKVSVLRRARDLANSPKATPHRLDFVGDMLMNATDAARSRFVFNGFRPYVQGT